MADSPEIDAIFKLVNIVAGVRAIKGLHEPFQADVFVVVNLPRQLSELPRHLGGELPERELEGLGVLPARVGGEFVGGLFYVLPDVFLQLFDVVILGFCQVRKQIVGLLNRLFSQFVSEIGDIAVYFMNAVRILTRLCKVFVL
ncbi:type I secretion outer membrane family protein, putative [Babesia ovata]|uniref:Type I secretion outer membrane family protein, putative n=1 Tax=Babesia ovata TaxID=189622 RepID=A0A2H6KJF8_9APIC|nr:type I secretion outer membrane family protein, putative [Babesia ovata]XP_028869417.1 type I secretion outer membrane family protein, putative [Babesia ovata]GBE63124.1 type I secretion outer membrane family protein, putative [Babesia ovata]GBE63174.1 type I secretion outer membrane family protein, putative [Babesia ovata]